MAQQPIEKKNGKLRFVGNPDSPEGKKQQALKQFDTILVDLTDNWADLSTAQKINALKSGVVASMTVIRWAVTRR